MTQLSVFLSETPAAPIEVTTDFSTIADKIASLGARLEKWQANTPIAPHADHAAILSAYAEDIERIKQHGGYTTADVVRLNPDHPDKEALRAKFLDEHTHSEDEVRFFVEGSGAFYINAGQHIFQLICEQGDLLSVPANTPHWFDMGPRPNFTAIRIFTNPAGWVGNFTGSGLSAQYPRYGD
ncbi:1,2-dihydroxy-3-keto-5-methylthiopentene dioxygenase [Uliginosibacterium gangwonense]|uniref:1,2-dihydroxy-3-keto-5-methylthiopentene dioxygenase n=1 Tax=Uliginosibacterium gangwonense TaxID=392736 RepID=UPI00037C8094|nr:cupin domain-containing protein [Uliginosibacterium gangwonense]